ncbi:tRNA (N(6)-L-threonylcarbamoyladenosine(37)-C(2))-methylthiotran sferase [Chlorella sorokiniana]|uniref:tRNA (N(6)-L-threonylcarbamoyladenosine(37)-C(2))-methylthiotran sferase n=1 Tax=Chlorella sorokiniana TaxID=3076 RepID=A0A2P6TXD6_CHLSO|nr:tRNA (N(6)-L-threonylcarbamoyladenosine(37)-C(2))-methylthiotran sferase [Chlorella sorokiniana]|eukprot:PRW58722.1 tRNA (N(6)-L-threonylcarbamoyladenosine(37)-C(2))-methylthiotran sferase [Chlorella sorokiniana]
MKAGSGTVCTPAVFDAICQAIGFDKAWDEDIGGEPAAITNATTQEAVRSLTGEYCLRAGVYSQTIPDDLASLPGEPCQKVDSITCIRNRQTIVDALQGAIPFERVPPAAEPVLPPEPKVVPAEGTAGRKLRL